MDDWTYRPPSNRIVPFSDIAKKVKTSLRKSDQLAEFADKPLPAGCCYVATEALYYLTGAAKSGLQPYRLIHENLSHWFLVGIADGKVYDLTEEQYSTPVPHGLGFPTMFHVPSPDERTKVLLQRILAKGGT